MPSATSFFSGTLYRSNLSRFWPLWALYALLWVFRIPLNLLNDILHVGQYGGSERFVRVVAAIPGSLSLYGTASALVFGLFAAMAVFSFLYSSRSACAMHALPLRREALFFTSWLSGLSFLLLPHALVVVLTLLVGLLILPLWTMLAQTMLLWFLAQSALCLFFFSFAAFCAMFTGHILALPAFYGILNGLVAGILYLVQNLCSELLYGFAGFESPVTNIALFCTPALELYSSASWTLDSSLEGVSSIPGSLENPLMLAVYGGIGLILTGIALVVYRLRHVETAGDVVSVPVVRPLFRYGMALCVGLTLGSLTVSFFSAWGSAVSIVVSLVLWTAIGCFVAEMFLRRSFRVWKAWKDAAVISLLMAALCCALTLDWIGFETTLPDVSRVVSLTASFPDTAPFDSARHRTVTVTEPEEIEAYLNLHQALIDIRDTSDPYTDYNSPLELHYTLQDGRTITRSYYMYFREEDLAREGSVTWAAQQLVGNRKLVEQIYGFDRREASGRVVSAYLSGLKNPETGEPLSDLTFLSQVSPAELAGLWEAVRADFEEGNIGTRYLFYDSEERLTGTYYTDLIFEFSMETSGASSEGFTITLTPQARHTLDWLEAHNAFADGELMTQAEYAAWANVNNGQTYAG